ncbi:MAG: hypothetical protein ACQEXB_18640 [Bacillota bacterium]
MKKLLTLMVIGLLTIALVACGSEESSSSSNDDTKTKEEPKAAEQKEVSNDVPEPEKDESGNTILEVVGQKAESDNVTAELMKIKTVNETLEVAPLTVTIKDLKLIKLTNMSEEFKSNMELNAMLDSVPDEITYVQISYATENKEEKNIEWYDLMNVVTDKGEQIDGQLKDFIVDDADMDSQFLGKVKKDFTDGFILKDGDINKVKLIFGYTMDADSYEDITPEQQVEYTFE